MRPLHSTNTHNINRLFIYEANFFRPNWLSQESLTKYIGNLLIPEGKPSFRQSLQDKVFQINQLVFQNLYYKSYLKLGFYGCLYYAVVSL
jgi:phage repressor protein C with HTH and peptisase S24 domain